MYLVELMPKAIKNLKALPKSDTKKVVEKIRSLEAGLNVCLKSRPRSQVRCTHVFRTHAKYTAMNKLITDNQIAITNLAKQHGIKTICLFGSMAKDDVSDNSDVDFLVELEQGRDLFDLGELLMDLQALLQRKVDLVTKTSLHPRLYAQVLNEALPL